VSRLFDTVLIVDWSARGSPSPRRPSPDAVWIGHAGETCYFRTRAEALDWLTGFLAGERAAGRRALAGFDFPFGYPRGLAAALTGRAEALAVWELLAGLVTDAPDNANNRFEVAAALNARLPGTGPFWGRPPTLDLAALPERGRDRSHPYPERRLVEERVRSAQPTWKLYTTGSVGGQVLTGLPALWRLRQRLGAAVWPFDTGLRAPDAPVVLAEVYPSLLAARIAEARRDGETKDAAQVRVAADAYAALDAAGGLAPLFAPELAPDEGAVVAREEAWILGAGHEAALRAAGLPPPRDDCFALPPGVNWVPVDEALARLRELAPVAGIETVPVGEAGGRVLAEPVRARRANPPAANAAVDGYGFAHASLGPPPHGLLLLAGRAAAGMPGPPVSPGRALRILTGALLPKGVDTVVLEEDTRLDGDTVRFERSPKPRANTRAAGEDVMAGTLVLDTGRRLAPQDLALAAAVGLGELKVRRRLRVGVLSTGDEIVPGGAAAAPHQTWDANRPMLLEIVRRWDMTPVDLGHAPDSPEAVAAALDGAEADAILTSGGASAGDEDHVSRLLQRRGALTTWRIAVKPGRPLALGRWNGRPVFGLPGNPVAAFVCTLVFARPALLRLAGAPWERPEGIMLPAAFEKRKRGGRREYLRARPNGNGAVEVFASEGSGRISGLAWARGLVELDDGPRAIHPGDLVRYLSYSEFGL
jgi:molybdopterin molybdotransferase